MVYTLLFKHSLQRVALTTKKIEVTKKKKKKSIDNNRVDLSLSSSTPFLFF
jgi:hypothetical protein